MGVIPKDREGDLEPIRIYLAVAVRLRKPSQLSERPTRTTAIVADLEEWRRTEDSRRPEPP
jgi:hypothetical protein